MHHEAARQVHSRLMLSDDIDINLTAERKPHKDIQIPDEHCVSGKTHSH